MKTASGIPAFGVVILAAGRSLRMGQPKLLLPWGQTSVLGYLLEQWKTLGAQQIVVVCAEDDQGIAHELNRLRVPESNRVLNAAPERGMFSSIQCAANWKGQVSDLSHWVITLGDQPHLQMSTLRQLLQLAVNQLDKVCQPARAGKPRHPVILPKSIFEQLADSPADNLKEFLQNQKVVVFDSDDAGLDLDIDRPEDYERARCLKNL